MNLEQALNVLELKDDCSFDETKRAYREMIQIWHPDRYSHNNQLFIRANTKTKALNSARDYLTNLGERGFLSEQRKLHQKKLQQNKPPYSAQPQQEKPTPPRQKAPKSKPKPSANSTRRRTALFSCLLLILSCLFFWQQQNNPRSNHKAFNILKTSFINNPIIKAKNTPSAKTDKTNKTIPPGEQETLAQPRAQMKNTKRFNPPLRYYTIVGTHVLKSPSSLASPLAYIQPKTPVSVRAQTGPWLEIISTSNQSGYIYAQDAIEQTATED